MPSFFKVKKLYKVSGLYLERIELFLVFFLCLFFIYFFPTIGNVDFNEYVVLPYTFLYFLLFVLSFTSNKIKYNLKLFIEYLYGFGFTIAASVAFNNGFNKDSLFAFLIVFSYISVTYRSVKSYLIVNSILIVFFICEYFFFPYEIEIDRAYIYLSYFIIFFIGYFITQVRNIIRNKLTDRKNFSNYLFNSSLHGLILVNKDDFLLYDLNDKAKKIFGITSKYDVFQKKINQININGELVFGDFKEGFAKTIELKDKRVLGIKSDIILFKKKKYFFIYIDEYKDLIDLNKTSEFKKLKVITEQSYNYLFEESSSMLAILNRENEFIDLNNTLANVLGYKKEELIGKSIDLITHQEIENREEINKNVWNGESQKSFEKRVISKDGIITHVEIILRKGMFLGQEVIISNGRSIEDRKKLERESLINYERYKRVTEESAIGFVVANIDGKIIDSNKAFLELLEYTKQEIEGFDIDQITHKEDLVKSKKVLKQLLEREIEIGEIEKRYYAKSGKLIYTLLKIILQCDEAEKPQFFFAQIVDITAIREAQKELEISERSYKELFDNSLELLYILNEKNKFIDVNKSVIEKYGYEKSEIIGKTPLLFAAPDLNDVGYVIDQLGEVWKGKDFNILWWAKKKSGEIFPKKLTIRLGYYNGEKALIASGVDISESYNYEKKLKQKEKSYRDLFERNLAGVYRTSFQGKILECNQAFLDILGYNQEDYLNAEINAYDLHLKEEDRDKLIQKIKENNFIRGEKISLKTKSGNYITALLNASSINDEEGNFKYFEGSVIDISEQEKIQKQLKKRETQYKDLINNSSFAIVITRESRILFSNQKSADILGYGDKEELIGVESFDVLLREEKDIYEKQLEELKKYKQVPFMNYSVKRKDGSLVDVECKPSIIIYEGKTCILLSFIDISDKNKIKAATEKIKATEKFNVILQNQLKEKEVLLKEVYHRVKNNMQVISSILNLQSTYIEDENLTAIIRDSQNRINSMALIHEKLYNTKDFSNINFANYITDLCSSLVNSYNSKSSKIDLVFNLEEVELSLNNAIPLGLILNELISNSLKYAFKEKEEGEIKIKLTRKEEEISLEFSDNGKGLPENVNFRDTKTLGLQLVNTLVEQIRGEIGLINEHGVSFLIKFNRFE